MAKVLTDDDCITHLRGKTGTLCGAAVYSDEIKDAPLQCRDCAMVCLDAIMLTTKAERREWRAL